MNVLMTVWTDVLQLSVPVAPAGQFVVVDNEVESPTDVVKVNMSVVVNVV